MSSRKELLPQYPSSKVYEPIKDDETKNNPRIGYNPVVTFFLSLSWISRNPNKAVWNPSGPKPNYLSSHQIEVNLSEKSHQYEEPNNTTTDSTIR